MKGRCKQVVFVAVLLFPILVLFDCVHKNK